MNLKLNLKSINKSQEMTLHLKSLVIELKNLVPLMNVNCCDLVTNKWPTK